MRRFLASLAGAAVLALGMPANAADLGSPFTYQGRLVVNGQTVDGAADIQFQLYDAQIGGSAVGAPSVHMNQSVFEGLFTVDDVDFGFDAFNGQERFLEITVRTPAGVGVWTPLSPRQRLAPTPYALFSARPWVTDGNDIYYPGTFVGIGTDNPNYRLHVQSTTPRAIYGICTNTSGNTSGIWGQSESTGGEGVTGVATAATGTTSGIYGQSNSATGRGVFGLATDTGGANYGLQGPPRGPFGAAVAGLATSNNQAATASGVRGETEAVFGAGVYGIASHSTGVTYGVRGSAASPNGWAGYFEGRGRFSGDLGVGSISLLDGPLARLHVARNSLGLNPNTSVQGDDLIVEDTDAVVGIYSAGGGNGGSAVALAQVDGTFGNLVDKWTMIRETNAAGGGLRFTYGTDQGPFNNPTRVFFAANGDVGIGTLNPSNRLSVAGTANINGNTGIGTSNPEVRLHVVGGSDAELDGGGYVQLGATANPNLVMDQNEIMARNNGAAADLFLNYEGGDVNPAANGTTRVRVLEITGADLAEKFPASEELKPGMVTAIDPANPGKLCLARGAYNRGVAGVVSGANDFSVGAVLGHLPGNEDAPPIALSGRVYVWCDATDYAIEPTDMLTTSATPGHAMKVVDFDKAHGAVIGKAMTGLAKGEKGMVLVLVNLQ